MASGTVYCVYGRSIKFFSELEEYLIQAVKDTLLLDYPNKDGVTNRQIWEQTEKSSKGKVRDPRLDTEILVPIEGQFIFELFWELRSGIGSSGFGPNPISQMEIFSYMSNIGVELSPGEIKTLKKLDSEYLDYISKQIEKDSKSK